MRFTASARRSTPKTRQQCCGREREVPVPPPLSGELAIRILVDEVDGYFAALSGAGVAETRAGLSVWRNGPVTPRAATANLVVDRWMADALTDLALTHPALAGAIRAARPHLNWLTFNGYPVGDIGAAFASGHAYASILGEDAAIPAIDWDMGIFLIAPHMLYRDHSHQAPELYAPLTGPHGWRSGPEKPLVITPAHRTVWSDPFVPHLTKVGPVPFLSLYARPGM